MKTLLDSVEAKSDGGLLGSGLPGTNTWNLYGYKDGEVVVQLVGEGTGFGSNTAKWEKWCNYVFNAKYAMNMSQIEYLSDKLSLSAGEAFDKAKAIGCVLAALK